MSWILNVLGIECFGTDTRLILTNQFLASLPTVENGMRVSFIGLGKMGQAMAGRILEAGHELAVYNRTPGKAEDIVRRGAVLAGSVGEAARFGEVVVTMLENDAALNEIALGGGGLCETMPQRAIHVAMGTHSITTIESLTRAHKTAAQLFVSAPVLGRPPAAAAGQLGIITGGPADAVVRCRPLFDAMGRRTFDAGEAQAAAAAAKIANNFVLAAAIEAMGEGFALAEKCGVAGAAFLEILTDGVFAGIAYKTYGKIIAEKNYYGEPGFSATTGLKDLNLALAAAAERAVPLPTALICRDRLNDAIARGDGGRDWAVMALEQARASGLA
jgi:3-hydroxyisobutyrate dehydrogenase-like beta-hydroxyacid dehydrogenase